MFPVTLVDGGLILSVGEPALVGDTVVLSVPLLLAESGEWSQLVTLPLAAVDWPITMRHADAVRAARYAERAGGDDYARLTADVARALQLLVATDDVAVRSRNAIDTRRKVFDWSVAHHGYRHEELQEMVAMLDARLARLAPGQVGPVRVTMLPLPPPPAPSIDLEDPVAVATQAITAARLTLVPAERTGMLQGVLGLIETEAEALPRDWRSDTTRELRAWVETEARLDRAYGEMIAMLLARAHLAAREADVAEVTAVAEDLATGDDELGAHRPGMVAAVGATIERMREEAEALDRERRAWASRSPHHEALGERLARTLVKANEHRPLLEGIGSRTVGALDAAVLERRFKTLLGTLETPRPPAGFEGVHSLLRRALQLAAGAARLRRETDDPAKAGDAASAASGALMLLDETEASLGRLLSYPELP